MFDRGPIALRGSARRRNTSNDLKAKSAPARDPNRPLQGAVRTVAHVRGAEQSLDAKTKTPEVVEGGSSTVTRSERTTIVHRGVVEAGVDFLAKPSASPKRLRRAFAAKRSIEPGRAHPFRAGERCSVEAQS